MRVKQMRSAPKDREILLRFRNHVTGDRVFLQGCWMAPGGDISLLGWWVAGAAIGSKSVETGVPHSYQACVVTPDGWIEIPKA